MNYCQLVETISQRNEEEFLLKVSLFVFHHCLLRTPPILDTNLWNIIKFNILKTICLTIINLRFLPINFSHAFLSTFPFGAFFMESIRVAMAFKTNDISDNLALKHTKNINLKHFEMKLSASIFLITLVNLLVN